MRLRLPKRTADPVLDPGQVLDSIPTPNAAVRCEERGDTLVLWVPFCERWWVKRLGWFMPFRTEKGIELDATGLQVWSACDGRRLEAIVEEFAERHKLGFHKARLCVLAFLRSLAERNLLALVVPEARK